MLIDELRGIISAMDGDLQSLSDTIAGSQAPWDADKRAEMKAQREEGEKLRGEWKALEEQAELHHRYGERVAFGPIEIRSRDPDGVRTEPHMALRVECRTDRLPAIVADLSWREAFVMDRQCDGSRSTLRATAPLALLLGYPTLLVRMDASATLTSWLAFYARLGGRYPCGSD